MDKEDLDQGHRASGRCAVSRRNKKLRDAVRKLREERMKKGRFRREILQARRAAMVAAAAEVAGEETGTLSPLVAREGESESAEVGGIAGVSVLQVVGDESNVAARQDPSEESSILPLLMPDRRSSRSVAQSHAEIPSIIVTDTEIEKECPSEASLILLPSSKSQLGCSKMIVQNDAEIPNMTVTDTEADEKKTSEASVVALPSRPKRVPRRLVAQDHIKIPSIVLTDSEADK